MYIFIPWKEQVLLRNNRGNVIIQKNLSSEYGFVCKIQEAVTPELPVLSHFFVLGQEQLQENAVPVSQGLENLNRCLIQWVMERDGLLNGHKRAVSQDISCLGQ